MNKIIIFIIAFALVLLLSGCVSENPSATKIKGNVGDKLAIFAQCEDKVICYYHSEGYGAGMSCFQNQGLWEKYCK